MHFVHIEQEGDQPARLINLDNVREILHYPKAGIVIVDFGVEEGDNLLRLKKRQASQLWNSVAKKAPDARTEPS